MPTYKLQPVSLLYVKAERKYRICNRFCGILCKGPVLMEQVLKNADISVFSKFLAIFRIFSRYREILPGTIYVPNFRSIGPFKQKLPICKKPCLFKVKHRAYSIDWGIKPGKCAWFPSQFLHDRSKFMKSKQTSSRLGSYQQLLLTSQGKSKRSENARADGVIMFELPGTKIHQSGKISTSKRKFLEFCCDCFENAPEKVITFVSVS